MLKPDLEHFTFYGEETIYVKIEKPTKEITLHSSEIEILSVKFVVDNKKEIQGTISYDEKSETATFSFENSLSKGDGQIILTFNGILNDKMRGFYRSKYEVDGVSMHMAVSQFESTDARRAFPCFDEPSLKAVFDVTLMIPQNTTAISNTIEDKVIEHESGYKLIQFVPTPKMSTYLLAFIVGKFEYIEKKISYNGTLVRVFVTPGKKKQAEFALDTAVKALLFYEEYFDIKYPLAVLDLIAIPDFAAGAMENWGAVTFRETALLVDENLTSAGSKQWVALVIAHELAHMWFGNLVTMEWWTHLWLNEGFACFIEYLAVDKLFPQFDIWTQFIATEHNSALSLDGLKNTHPIEIPVKHPSEINEIFDEVSYAKGASIIKMLASFLGEKVFRDGLRIYLKKHAYQNAKTEHLWDAFSKVSKKDIGKLMHNWTQKPGYPLVEVKEETNRLKLSQKRYFSSSVFGKNSSDKTVWNIPLNFLTSGGEDVKKYLMDKNDFSVNMPSQKSWITINSAESSFIRVKYSQKLLNNFKTGVQNKTLSPSDRLGILRDAFSLSESGYSQTTDALDLAKEFKEESDYTVWVELASGIHRVFSITHENENVSALYRLFAKEIFSQRAAKIGWEKSQGEKHTDVLLRSLLLYGAGTYGDKTVLAKAKELFAKFLSTGNLDPDIRGVVYSLVAENGGEKEFKTFIELYKKELLHQEKDRLARAIASFTDKNIIKTALEWSVSENVRSQDSARVLFAIFVNPFGRALAWEFLTKNWKYYYDKLSGSHGFSRVLEGASFLTSEKYVKEIEDFFAKNKTPELKRTIPQVLEQIKANTAWLKRDENNILNFLKTQ